MHSTAESINVRELARALRNEECSFDEKLQSAKQLAKILAEPDEIFEDRKITVILRARYVKNLVDWLFDKVSKVIKQKHPTNVEPPKGAILQQCWQMLASVLSLPIVSSRQYLPPNLLLIISKTLEDLPCQCTREYEEAKHDDSGTLVPLPISLANVIRLLGTKFRSSYKPTLEPTSSLFYACLKRLFGSSDRSQAQHSYHETDFSLATSAAKLLLLVLRSQPNPRKKWDAIVPRLVHYIMKASNFNFKIQCEGEYMENIQERDDLNATYDTALESLCKAILDEALFDSYHLPFISDAAKTVGRMSYPDLSYDYIDSEFLSEKYEKNSIYSMQFFTCAQMFVTDELKDSGDYLSDLVVQRGLPLLLERYCTSLDYSKSLKRISASISGKDGRVSSKGRDLRPTAGKSRSEALPELSDGISQESPESFNLIQNDSDFCLFISLSNLMLANLERHKHNPTALPNILASLGNLCTCLKSCSIYRPMEDVDGLKRKFLAEIVHQAFFIVSNLDKKPQMTEFLSDQIRSSSMRIIQAVLDVEHRIIEDHIHSLWPLIWSDPNAWSPVHSSKHKVGIIDVGHGNSQQQSSVSVKLACKLIEVYAELRQLNVLLISLQEAVVNHISRLDNEAIIAKRHENACAWNLMVHPDVINTLKRASKLMSPAQGFSIVDFVSSSVTAILQEERDLCNPASVQPFEFIANVGSLCLTSIPIDLTSANKISKSVQRLVSALKEPIQKSFQSLCAIYTRDSIFASSISALCSCLKISDPIKIQNEYPISYLGKSFLEFSKSAEGIKFSAALWLYADALELHFRCCLLNPTIESLPGQFTTNSSQSAIDSYFDALDHNGEGIYVNYADVEHRMKSGFWLYDAFWMMQQRQDEVFHFPLEQAVRKSSLQRLRTLYIRRLNKDSHCKSKVESDAEEKHIVQLNHGSLRETLALVLSLKPTQADMLEMQHYCALHFYTDQQTFDDAQEFNIFISNGINAPKNHLSSLIQPSILRMVLSSTFSLKTPDICQNTWKLLLRHISVAPNTVLKCAYEIHELQNYAFSNAIQNIGVVCRKIFENLNQVNSILEFEIATQKQVTSKAEKLFDIALKCIDSLLSQTGSDGGKKKQIKAWKSKVNDLVSHTVDIHNFSSALGSIPLSNVLQQVKFIRENARRKDLGMDNCDFEHKNLKAQLKASDSVVGLVKQFDVNIQLLMEMVDFYTKLNFNNHDNLDDLVHLAQVGQMLLAVSLSIGYSSPGFYLESLKCTSKASQLVALSMKAIADKPNWLYPLTKCHFLDFLVAIINASSLLKDAYAVDSTEQICSDVLRDIIKHLKVSVQSYMKSTLRRRDNEGFREENEVKNSIPKEFKSILKRNRKSKGHTCITEACLDFCVMRLYDSAIEKTDSFSSVGTNEYWNEPLSDFELQILTSILEFSSRHLPNLADNQEEYDSYVACTAHLLKASAYLPVGCPAEVADFASVVISRIPQDIDVVTGLLISDIQEIASKLKDSHAAADTESLNWISIISFLKDRCLEALKYVKAVTIITSQMKPSASDEHYVSILALLLHILRITPIDYKSLEPKRKNWPFTSLFPAAQGLPGEIRSEALSSLSILLSGSTNKQLHWVFRFVEKSLGCISSIQNENFDARNLNDIKNVHLFYLLPTCELALMALEVCKRKTSLERFWERLTLPADLANFWRDMMFNLPFEKTGTSNGYRPIFNSSFQHLKQTILLLSPSNQLVETPAQFSDEQCQPRKKMKRDLVEMKLDSEESLRVLNNGTDMNSQNNSDWRRNCVYSFGEMNDEFLLSLSMAWRCLESIAARPKMFQLSNDPWWPWTLHRTLESVLEIWEHSYILTLCKSNISAICFVNCCRLLVALMRHRGDSINQCITIISSNISAMIKAITRWEILGTFCGRILMESYQTDTVACAKELADVMEVFANMKYSKLYCAHILGDYIRFIASPMSLGSRRMLVKEINCEIHVCSPQNASKGVIFEQPSSESSSTEFETIRPELLAILQQGAFALYDSCDSIELQYLYSLMNENRSKDVNLWKNALEELRMGYERFYKYTGKV